MSSQTQPNSHSLIPESNSKSHSLPGTTVYPTPTTALSQIRTEGDLLPPSRRLIVVLPDVDFDLSSLPRRLWSLAAPNSREMLLLLKPASQENEYHARMNLATLAASIRDSRVNVQIQLVLGTPLDQAVSQSAASDDVIVCFEDHVIPGIFTKMKRVSDILAQKTNLPVFTLKGPVSQTAHPISASRRDIVLFAVYLITLVLFFAVGIWIDQNMAGVSRTIAEILVLLIEVWIIAACAARSFRF